MNINFFDSKTYEFLQSLDSSLLARVTRSLDLLEKYGNLLRLPHTKKISKSIYELRIVGANQIRILFTYYRSEIWILYAFVKKSQKIPKKEIMNAERILKYLRQK